MRQADPERRDGSSPRGDRLIHSAVFWLVAVATAVGYLAWWTATQLPLGAWFLPRTLLVFTAGAALILSTLRRGHSVPRFGLANGVTAVRFGLVAVILALTAERRAPEEALAASSLALIVVLLDGIDGWLARRAGTASAFGARFDMETDALLILALAALAWMHGKAGAWVLLSGLYRYAFVAAGNAHEWMARTLPASRRRQTICVVQIVALLVALLPPVPPAVSAMMLAVAWLMLSWSFYVDTRWLWRSKVKA